jgi:hypothetical protein
MKIKETFQKNGFIYKLTMTGERALIYEQRDGDKVVAYEVHRLRPRLSNYSIEPIFTNRLPRNESFGKWAWSYYPSRWGKAIVRFFEVEQSSRQNASLTIHSVSSDH